MAFAVNKPVKKTIVMGLKIVIRNTDVKLARISDADDIAEGTVLLSNTLFTMRIPNRIKMTELIIPKPFLNSAFSSNLPIPRIDSAM